MTVLIGILTAVMVIICLFLILLVMVQLPKKEAGAGMAFGGAATDALFGAGSGNVLTKITRNCAIGFFALALILSWASAHQRNTTAGTTSEQWSHKALTPSAPVTPAVAPTSNALPTTGPITAPVTTAPAPAVTAPAATNK